MSTLTTNDVTMWDDVQHTRKRPSVNLGTDPFTTGARELVDNAVEEAANHGSQVRLTLHTDGSLTVEDDGRGLPVDTHAVSGLNGVVMVLGTARSGTKFADHHDADATSAGTNGIGAAAAVFVSRRTDITVWKNGKRYEQNFSNGYPAVFKGEGFNPDAPGTRNDQMTLRGVRDTHHSGTRVRILFDYTLSPAPLDISELILRAHAAVRLTYTNKNQVRLTVVDEGYPGDVPASLVGTFEGPWGTASLLDLAAGYFTAPRPAAVAEFEGRGTYTSARETPFRWAIAAGPAESDATYGWVNTVRTPKGGSHVNAAVKGVSEALAQRAARLRGLGLAAGEDGPEAQDFAACTVMVIDARVPDAPWDSQAKMGVSSASLNRNMTVDVVRQVSVWAALPANADLLLVWARTALARARVRRASEGARDRARAKVKRDGSLTNLSLPAKFIPSRVSGRGSGAEVLPCEGKSAAQTIKDARDADTQAIYPLRGKVLNAWGIPLDKARKNEEFADVETILNCGIGDSADPDKCRYDRIIFTADADPDGAGINSGLGATFLYWYRPLIAAGMVFVAVPPLYVITTGKGDRLYARTDEDKNTLTGDLRAQGKRFTVDRCKGLGEMDAEDFYATVLDPARRTLLKLTLPDESVAQEHGDILFGNDPQKRRDWIEQVDPAARAQPVSLGGTDYAAEVLEVALEDFWDAEYLAYALYTIASRAIPYADTGLKPVEQRILYTALRLGATPGASAPKTARLAAETAGTLHPHGSASIEDTLGVMAGHYQRASMIDGLGAFPRTVGAPPASARYTHTRLSPLGYELVRDLRDGGQVVPFTPSYDERTEEPVILPSRFPALVVGGAEGMATGWATKVPSHNPREVMALTRALVECPELDDDTLCSLITGPDWGSGGEVIGDGGLREYLLTGRGLLTVSGKIEVDGKHLRISEMPPSTSLETLVSSLREAALSGKVPQITDVSDLGGRGDPVNIRIDLKRGSDPAEVVRLIRDKTVFEDTFGVNIVAVDEQGIPSTWAVRSLILRFIALRHGVVLRRSENRLVKARERRHLVSGLQQVRADLRTAVAIIMDSEDPEAARAALAARFGLDEPQLDYVFGLKVDKLTRLDEHKLAAEAVELDDEIATLDELCTSEVARSALILDELDATGKVFAGPEYDRRTVLRLDAVPAKATRVAETVKTVNPRWRLDETGVLSESHGALLTSGVGWAVWAGGKVKLTHGDGLPQRITETPVAPNLDGLIVAGVMPVGTDLALVSRSGRILRLDGSKIPVHGKASNGVQGMKLAEDDAVVAAFPITDQSMLLSVSEKGWKVLACADVPVKGRGTAGVGFHPFVKGDTAILSVEVSTTGFVNDGAPVRAAKRAGPTSKTSPVGVVPAAHE